MQCDHSYCTGCFHYLKRESFKTVTSLKKRLIVGFALMYLSGVSLWEYAFVWCLLTVFKCFPAEIYMWAMYYMRQ